MLKKVLALLTALLLCSSFALADGTTFSMAGFDGDDSSHVWDTNLFFSRMTEKTGVSFTFKEYTNYETWQNTKSAMFSMNQLPDLFFKAELTSAEQIRYYEAGQLIDLRPYLQEYAPNFYALLQANPEWEKEIALDDGAIVALPTVNGLASQNCMWINKTWLDTLGLELPTDVESFENVLIEFRDKDPNRNGKRDEIPLTFLGPWDLKFLGHAFGIIANDYNMYTDENGKACFAAVGENYRTFITWLNKLYTTGLIDKSGFTTADTMRTISDDKAALTYGIIMSSNPANLVTSTMAENYVLLPPLTHEGKQEYRELYSKIIPGTFAVTKECKDVGAALSWVDYLYTEEGGRLALAGIEGVEYTMTTDGKWDWNGDSYTVAYDIAVNNIVSDTGNMPWLVPVEFELSYDNASSRNIFTGIVEMDSYVVKPFPPFKLNAEDQSKITAMQNVLGAYVDSRLGRFVMGQVELNDENWAAYEKGLEEAGLADFVSFWQAVADR